MAAPRKPRTAKPAAWRKDRITSTINEDTGRREVDLSGLKVPGMTAAQVREVYDFEASVHGTVKAVLRMQKREAGTLTVPVTAKIAAATIPASIKKFYA